MRAGDSLVSPATVTCFDELTAGNSDGDTLDDLAPLFFEGAVDKVLSTASPIADNVFSLSP
ncbi:MAG: hypothetical protein A2657_00400 [Candidatus Yanofskybacteria bacterium RIFCSPHIGHO2_01_FULL_44_110b]|nr:MAG: hypothetical protein A2657_00400 [Candidatus Yanofskybacteria bacterium RIFCSPHIGHO2_01_FULL_44_110b]